MARSRRAGRRVSKTRRRKHHRRGRGHGKRRGHSMRRKHRGGSVIGGVVSALKTALPSIVLYEALRMQGKRVKRKGRGRTRRGGKSRRRR